MRRASRRSPRANPRSSDAGYKHFWAVKYQWDPSRPDGWSLHSNIDGGVISFKTKKDAERWLAAQPRDPETPESVVMIGPIK